MPLYKIYNAEIEASTPDLACIKYAKLYEKELHKTRKNIEMEYILFCAHPNLPSYLDNLEKFIDAQYIQIGTPDTNIFYPIRNFEILLENIEKS
jgi:hypothetical protein